MRGVPFWPAFVYNGSIKLGIAAGKGCAAVKKLLRVLYVALVGLIVFTGALYIVKGVRTQKTASQKRVTTVHRRAPGGPSLPL